MRGRHSRRHFREIGWRAQRYHLTSPVLFPFSAGLRSQAPGLLAGQVQEHVAKGSSFLHWPPLIALERPGNLGHGTHGSCLEHLTYAPVPPGTEIGWAEGTGNRGSGQVVTPEGEDAA